MQIEQSLSKKLEIRNSPIHGIGVFAASFLPKGTILPWINSREISPSELAVLPLSEQRYTDVQR